jgi:hypothetical protein
MKGRTNVREHAHRKRFEVGRKGRVVVACVVALIAIAVGAGLAVGGSGGSSESGGADQKASAAAAENQVMEQARAKARASGIKKPNPLAARPKPDPDPIPIGPKVVPVSPPVPASQYLLDDMGWREVTGSRVKFVYAGAMPKNTSQGMVLVVTSTLPPADPPPDFVRSTQGPRMHFAVYPTPQQVGPVQIASADGRTLSLATSDGKVRFRFDAGSERYVSG